MVEDAGQVNLDEEFVNYASVEQDAQAGIELQRMVKAGFLKEFGSLQECTDFVQGVPTLSKLGMLTKSQTAKDGSEVTKRRLIFDGR
eukprot:5995903-Amphidinium_carterae.1